jgi:endonuclease YncB( thermonuclease family)
MQTVGGVAGASAVMSVGTATGDNLDIDDSDGTVGALSFYSAGSQLNAQEDPLEDDDVALVRAEPTAFNFETTDGPLFVEYPDDVAIPVVTEDTTDPVVGFGSAEFVADGNGGFIQDNEMFMANLFDEKISADGDPLVVWDESHGQFWGLGSHSTFEAYAEDQGYDLQASDDLLSDSGATLEFPSTASQIAPSGEDPLTNSDNIVIWAESTAENVDNQGDGAVIYPGETDIPLVSRDGSVFGFGTPELVNDDGITENNEQFLLNLLQETIGGSGTLLWDDAHGTFYDSSGYTNFSETVAAQGYEFLSSGDSILEDSTSGTLEQLEFFSTSSVLDGAGDPLTDASRVAVWGEETAYTNTDDYRNADDPVGEGPDIPLVAVDGGVVAIGSDFASDGSEFDANRTMLVNAWEDRIGDTGTVLYDETHGQNSSLGDFSQLETVAEDRGFTVDAITEDFTGALDGADAVMVASSNDDLTSFSDAELDALDSFVADGGALFLHNTSDFEGDSSAVLNDVLAGVGADLQFNSDQVEDPENNGFDTFVPRTGNFNSSDYSAFFDAGDGGGTPTTLDAADVIVIPSPSDAYTDEELTALETHISEGGAVFFFDQSEFDGFDETENLNAIADSLGLAFRFNPDQVEDSENNAGAAFVPTTTNFNESFDLFDGLGSPGFESADAVVVTSPSDAFTGEELTALGEFVSNGGALFLLDQADFRGFDETGNLNEIADSLDLDFRFNSDQINDEENNTGSIFDIATTNYDETRAVFEEREDDIGFEFERDEEYLARVVEVTDGDTFVVEFEDSEYGYTDIVRHIGIDTAETGQAANDPFEWFGVPDDALDHLDNYGAEGTNFALDLMAPEGAEAGDSIEGRSVNLKFDERESLRGTFGRLLMELEYDPDEFAPEPPESGEYATSYNRKIIEDGIARVYSSGYQAHDEFQALEEDALANNREVWGPADFDALEEYRTDFVNEVFVPRASSVTTVDGPLSDGDILRASDTAGQEPLGDGEFDEYEAAPPLAAVDTENRVAMFGGLLLDETWEAGEDDDITEQYDLDQAGNFPLFTNTVELLSDNDGPFIVEGGHEQFSVSGGNTLEDLKFYLRHIEGLSSQTEGNARLRQINNLPETLLDEPEPPRVVFLTALAREYTQADLDTLTQFRDAGGAVVLVGSASPTPDQRGNLDDIAAALGTDLRLNNDIVVDESGPIDDPELLVTDNVDAADGLRLPVHLDREFEDTGLMAALNNVGTSAWTLDAASEGVGETGVDNPTLSLEEESRHHVENRGAGAHPLAFRDADGNALLTQDGTGSFEDDPDVNWVDTGDIVEFTLTADLAAELDSYGCEVHPAMAGDIEIVQAGPPELPGGEAQPQDLDGDGLYEDVAGTGSLEVVDVQVLFDNLGTAEVQNNAEAFNFSGDQPGRVSIFDVQGLFSRLDQS